MHRLQQAVSHILPPTTPPTLHWHVDADKHKLKPLPSHYIIRSLELDDYHKHFFQLLSQLTKAPLPPLDTFTSTFHTRTHHNAHTYNTVVIEDTDKHQVIATATLLIEHKFIRNCGTVGHIEDVCVDSTYRGHDLGLYVTYALLDRARQLQCYKVILDCEPHNMKFYNRCGFVENAKHMAVYL